MSRPPLSPAATDAAKTRGRLHPEEESAHRTPFQRDRDRIIHSSTFRRLKHKTQVFVEHEGDHYRTRLTHSLEVAQIARTTARTLGADEDLAEAVALAHDLGHTPFGHTGEDALNEMMAEHGGFDHNSQALRIVTGLESRYAEFDGLNLTWEVLEGLAKHNGPLLDAEGADRSRLHFALAEYDARHDLELWTHAGLEAQIAALSDDIAYNTHDLDDGLRAGLFDFEDLADLPLVGPALAAVRARYPGLDAHRTAHEAFRRVFGALVEDMLTETKARLDAARPESAAALRALPEPVAAFSESLNQDLSIVRAFLFARMYRHFSVQRMRRKTGRVVRDLFTIFMEEPALLPEEWGEAAGHAASTGLRARIVADYIAGMTDRFALEEHRKLTDPMTPV
ncbi:deoxyguanosinetriphosphate triphosphohydrolase [Pikeienuella sp. HZG-20]|uniref:deoxyguanosinetriphosphate triphosphohydrolase n=1 Tax=Paludibacillus litoralis TaxID=3133267 RepID=UPI0030EB261A